MVASRLSKRVNYYQLDNFGQYYNIAMSPEYPHEFQVLVNILTTNETYFLREPKHFKYLYDNILSSWRGDNFRIWSAACSSGEEAYSLAMVIAEKLSHLSWEVIGSDISTKVLDKAQQGVYLMERLEHLDKKYLYKYCLKGVRSQKDFFRVNQSISKRTNFRQINLLKPLPYNIGKFDVIFLRNVLIYFNQATKKSVVENIVSALKPGGYFFISHSETLSRVTDKLEMIQPSIYMKK